MRDSLGHRSPCFSLIALLLMLLVVLGPRIVEAGQLHLNWVDASGGQAGFRIERKARTDAFYTALAFQDPGVTEYIDASALNGITYCYRVQAYDDARTSPYSKEACGSTATGLVLTVRRNGTGQGTVTSNPAGISCGTDCTQTYSTGAVVALAASAMSGSTFAGWSGAGCAGTDPCTLTGNAPVSVSATFNTVSSPSPSPPPPSTSYTLSVSKNGLGNVKSRPGGIACGKDCSQVYPAGTVVTLVATPGKNAEFVGWGGACSGTGPCSLTLGAAKSVSATFSRSRSSRK